jgi:hypothetical protein
MIRTRLRAKFDLGDQYPDTIRLGEGGQSAWKSRYYYEKFHVGQEDLPDFLPRLRMVRVADMRYIFFSFLFSLILKAFVG